MIVSSRHGQLQLGQYLLETYPTHPFGNISVLVFLPVLVDHEQELLG